MRRAVVTIFVEEHARAVRSACRIVGISRTAFAHSPAVETDGDATIIAQEHRWGFWKVGTGSKISATAGAQASVSRVLRVEA